ncbi:MAG: LysM peptidoglycan-binding domain-containing protein [Chloroflexi bacterium]|nr:LysM peptidoglycan-binding domain-containing protein [Chloroflexota bacterium]
MTRQQALFLILINAAVSTLVSAIVVLAAFSLYTPPPVSRSAEGGPLAPAVSPTRRTTALTYIVKPGDTLSLIAANFNISMAALMQANSISNANMVAVGQSLIIPPADIATPPLFSATGAAAATAVPILRISAIVRPAGAGATGEIVIIQNLGARLNLKGWTLSGLRGDVYIFPDIALESSSSVRVHSEAGLDTATDLYWGRTAPVWGANDTATLKDRNGTVIDSYTVRK